MKQLIQLLFREPFSALFKIAPCIALPQTQHQCEKMYMMLRFTLDGFTLD